MPVHDIDYRLIGDDLQIVEIELDPGESVRAEAGAMLYMDERIRMDTGHRRRVHERSQAADRGRELLYHVVHQRGAEESARRL